MPLVGVESGLNNVVPVDFVVKAIDHIAHLKGQDGGCFHITDPEHYTTGQMMNIFAEAAHAPKFTLRFDRSRLFPHQTRVRESGTPAVPDTLSHLPTLSGPGPLPHR